MADGVKQGTTLGMERLETLVQQEMALLGQVDALSQRQSTLMALEDPAPLVSLLDERQGLIERVAVIASEVATLREQCASVRAIPMTRWSAVQRTFKAVADLAEQIASRDREDAATMAKLRDGVVAERLQLDKGRGAATAYGTPRAGGASNFQDRHG